MKIVPSKGGVPIRLSEERMAHISRRHPEMQSQETKVLDTVSVPDLIQEGDAATKIALEHYPASPLTEKFCAVVYREIPEADGFVLTAYFCSRYAAGRRILWKP